MISPSPAILGGSEFANQTSPRADRGRFGDLVRDSDGRARVRLEAPNGERAVTVWLDEEHRYVMAFSGDDLPDPARRRRSLGVEPMTCPPNAFQTGEDVRKLHPGEEFSSAWGSRWAETGCPSRYVSVGRASIPSHWSDGRRPTQLSTPAARRRRRPHKGQHAPRISSLVATSRRTHRRTARFLGAPPVTTVAREPLVRRARHRQSRLRRR